VPVMTPKETSSNRENFFIQGYCTSKLLHQKGTIGCS
jgi:hypothetical protein